MNTDIENLTFDQARQLVQHFGKFSDVQTIVNNNIIMAIGESVLKRCPPDIADTLQKILNEWSSFMNHAADSSDAEVRRILGIQPSPSALQ